MAGVLMTAEEKLKELYERDKPIEYEDEGLVGSINAVHCDYTGGVFLAAEHIDLIADLVVERLKEK